jgi:hypothetical protein
MMGLGEKVSATTPQTGHSLRGLSQETGWESRRRLRCSRPRRGVCCEDSNKGFSGASQLDVGRFSVIRKRPPTTVYLRVLSVRGF